jgi:poly(3-hydroxybutyrate) depolymerase
MAGKDFSPNDGKNFPDRTAEQRQGNLSLLQFLPFASRAAADPPPPAAPEGAPPVPFAPPKLGENVAVPLTGAVPGYYELYLPQHVKPGKSIGIEYAADGVTPADLDHDCGKMMGKVNGLFREANQDGFAVACLEPQRDESFLLGLVRLRGFNLHDGIVGVDITKRHDEDYGHAVQASVLNADLPNHIRIDPKRQYCTGISLGGQMCKTLPGIKAVAEAASAEPKNSPLPKRNVSGLFVFGQKDPVLPYSGGLQPWYSSMQAFKTNYVAWTLNMTSWPPSERPRPSRLYESAPYELAQHYAAANGLELGAPISKDHFDKRIAGPNASGVKVVEYRLKDMGHTWPGAATGDPNKTDISAGNGETVRSEDFNMSHVAACFFGLRHNRDCQSEGVKSEPSNFYSRLKSYHRKTTAPG